MVSVLVRLIKITIFLATFLGAVVVLSVLKSNIPESESSENGTRYVDSLKTVIVVSSGGNCGAASDYPGDPYPLADLSYWPYGRLQLTSQGRVQMLSLGGKLRSLYDGYLKRTYDSRDLVASSSPVDSVVLSGQMVLAGLYPPRDHQEEEEEEEVAWHPAPLYTDSPDKTAVMLDGYCVAFTLAAANGRAQFAEEYGPNLTAVTDYVKNATGANLTAPTAVSDLYYKLRSEELEGYAIPRWAVEIFPRVLQPLVDLESKMKTTNTPEMTGLLIGELLADILGVMQANMNGSSTQKLHFYSGQDATLLGLLTALVPPPPASAWHVPPGSALLLELHRSDNTSQFTVQVLFVDGRSSNLDLRLVSLPKCDDPCDFYSFTNMTEKVTSVNLKEGCELPTSAPSSDDEQKLLHLPYTQPLKKYI